MKDKNLMVCVSGGRASAMMARHIQTSEKYREYNKVYVFCNTGMERPETIQFLKDIEKYWSIDIIKIEGVYSNTIGEGIGYKIVDFDTLNMSAKPFEGAIMHKNKGSFNGLPNQEAPYCSGALKTIPAKKLCDDIFGVNNYKKAIGFRLEDMPKRITWAEIKEDKNRIFPLLTDYTYPISQYDLHIFFNLQAFRLRIHGDLGNCELCWKKSNNKIVKNIRFGSRFLYWYEKMEKKYGNTSFREKKSIVDFIKMAKEPYTKEFDFDNDTDDKCICNF